MKNRIAALTVFALAAWTGVETSSSKVSAQAIDIPNANQYVVCKDPGSTRYKTVSLVLSNGEYKIFIVPQQGEGRFLSAIAFREGDTLTFESTAESVTAKYSITHQALALVTPSSGHRVDFWGACKVEPVQATIPPFIKPLDEFLFQCQGDKVPGTKTVFLRHQGRYGIFTVTNGKSTEFFPLDAGYLNPETVAFRGIKGSVLEKFMLFLDPSSRTFKMLSPEGELLETGTCEQTPVGP